MYLGCAQMVLICKDQVFLFFLRVLTSSKQQSGDKPTKPEAKGTKPSHLQTPTVPERGQCDQDKTTYGADDALNVANVFGHVKLQAG